VTRRRKGVRIEILDVKCYQVRIEIGCQIYLGKYKTMAEAMEVRDMANPYFTDYTIYFKSPPREDRWSAKTDLDQHIKIRKCNLCDKEFRSLNGNRNCSCARGVQTGCLSGIDIV